VTCRDTYLLQDSHNAIAPLWLHFHVPLGLALNLALAPYVLRVEYATETRVAR